MNPDDPLDRTEMQLRMALVEINLGLDHIRLARACRAATESLEQFSMARQASEMQSADVGEFDNRMHDWLSATP